uniref:R3H domain-containing protein n=1 Tax=Parascaris univalens TaxID=6257 RepID=A0A915AAF1_PARUN
MFRSSTVTGASQIPTATLEGICHICKSARGMVAKNALRAHISLAVSTSVSRLECHAALDFGAGVVLVPTQVASVRTGSALTRFSRK